MNAQVHSTEQSAMFLRDKGAWDSAIAAYSGPDPLELWYNYICWYDYNMQIDPENKFREALEKCLTLFEHNEAYKQDVRMVKLWIKYIDTQSNQLNLYQILYQRGVGTRCSYFYIGWAHYYDSANGFKQAESVYNLGFQAKAEPYDELQEAHTKFRISLSHRMLYTDNSSKKRSANHLIEQRQQITNLNPSKKARSESVEAAANVTTVDDSPTPQTGNSTQNHPQVQETQVQVQRVHTHHTHAQQQETQIYHNRPQTQQSHAHQVYSQGHQQTYTQQNSVQQNFHSAQDLYQTKQDIPILKQEVGATGSQIQQNANHAYVTMSQPQASQPPALQNQIYQQQKQHVPVQQAPVHPVQSQTAQRSQTVSTYTHVESDQCNLKNSAYVISSSLNYIYNDTQDETHHQNVEYTLENCKLPHNFVRFCKNNHESWKPLLYLEEPYDPNRRCIYRKDVIYPGGGVEFSPEELRSRKWTKKLVELKTNQHQSTYQQQSNTATSAYHVQKTAKVQQTQYNQAQQYAALASSSNSAVYDRNLEEQIEASTIKFSSDTGSGPKNKTITIKFKRDKSAPNSNSFSSSVSYGDNQSSTPQQQTYASEAKYQEYSPTNGEYNRNGNVYCKDSNDYKSDFNHDMSVGSTTLKVKKAKKVKIVDKCEELKSHAAYNLNNNSYRSPSTTTRKNYDDANLLLSFANTSSTQDVRPSDNSVASTTTNDTLTYNEDSLSNADFNSPYSESPYPNRSNCSTPIRKLSQSYSSKTSTPLCRTLKRHTSNLSVQNDDSMCSYEQNSFFATESNDDLKQKRLEKALVTIETHLAKEAIDPFNSELCKAFLTKIDFPTRDSNEPYKLVNTPIPKLANVKVTNLADSTYSVEKEVGRGSYGSVYKSTNMNTGQTVALKYQKPPNIWEIYICTEVHKRITNYNILPGFMDLSTAIIAPNASILVTEFSPYGSLLDINNKIRQSTKKVMHESLVMHFSSQILSIVSHLHSCKIIHADIKPDNFLLMRAPNSDSLVPSLRLIDFGCAIDMTLFPENTEFKKVIQTDGFTCIEMQEGRHWSYQTDYFCLAGTVHVMLFGDYMQVVKKFGAWEIKQKLPRYLKKHVWTDFFSKMLNIKDVDQLPNLMEMKGTLNDEASKMDSELQSQIRALSNLLHRR